MPPGEFYGLTPAEFLELVTFWSQRERRLDIRVAQLRLTTAQAMGAKAQDGRDLTIHHFLPEEKPETEPDLYQQFLSSIPRQWHPQDQLDGSS